MREREKEKEREKERESERERESKREIEHRDKTASNEVGQPVCEWRMVL